MARLEQIERILLQIPELANPKGFEVMAQFHGGARKLGPGETEQRGSVVEHMVMLYFFVPTKAIRGEGCPCLSITVNWAGILGSGRILDERGHEVYVEMARGEPRPLVTQVYGYLSPERERSFVRALLTSGGELPWRTVTRDEYYKAVIFDREGKGGEKLAGYRLALTKTPYQEWLAGAAQRKQNLEHTLKVMESLKKTPAEIAALRKKMEDTEREVTEKLKASEAVDRERSQSALTLSHSLTANMRAELDAMTAAQRALPALIDATKPDGPSTTGWPLVERDSPSAWRVLTPNYDFWRARRSAVEVRGIEVALTASDTGLSPPVHQALLQTWEKLDWAALNRLLDTPR
jgi:hypothetical protein